MTKKITTFLLFTLLIPLSSIAQLPDISFGSNPWVYSGGGITYDASTGILTIVGSPNVGSYRNATLNITIPAGIDSVFLEAEISLRNIKKGPVNHMTAKMKFEGLSATKNFPEGGEGIWLKEFVGNKVGVTRNVQVVFAVQQCTGTMMVRLPKLVSTKPTPTPFSYPFTVPSNPFCNIDLVSTDKQSFNNDLLSFNNHFIFTPTVTWNSPELISAINNHYPMSNYRFPGGTVGNHYNWKTDLVHNDAGSQAQMNWLIGMNRYFGYPGFKNQVLASGGTATLMFNVNSDTKADATGRLTSRIADGIDVKWIELGNETYYSHQSHGSASGGQFHVSDVDAYISYTSDLTTSLKSISSTSGIAIPIDHNNYNPGGWSDKIAKETYYDATVIHHYTGTGDPTLTYNGGLNLLTTYASTRKVINTYMSSFGNTPTLFTEWLSMGPSSILTTLSNADVFMGLLEGDIQDGIVKQTSMHMLYGTDGDPKGGVLGMYNGQMRHGNLGVLQSKLFEVFKGKDIFKALSTSDELNPGLPAIISKAVDFGDSVKVFSINKYPVEAKLTVTYDGVTLLGGYRMETYSNSNPSEALITYLDPRNAWVRTTGSGDKMLAGYSLTVTTIAKSGVVTSVEDKNYNIFKVYPNPANDYVFFDGVQMNEMYQLFDTNGKLVISGKVSSSGINVSQLSPGLYIVKVGSNIKKITIQ